MKKLYIIFLIIIFLILTGCTKVIEAKPIETQIVTITSIFEDTTKISELEKQLKDSKVETEKYQALIGNLNDLLKNVYYGYASNSKYILDGFTAFSIGYEGKYYLITAGHCVENEYGKFSNFKFKANFSDNWIYPKLLAYNNDNNNFDSIGDYAVFTDKNINSGFVIGKVYGQNIILGSINNKLNIIRNISDISIKGESGSPVINLNGEVIGIMTGGFIDINFITEAIDNLK